MSEDNGSVRYDAWMRRNPGHPGRHIRLGCMEDPDGKSMTVSEAAHKLGVSVVALSRVLNGRAGISVAMALKLEAAGWATADVWLNLQTYYDLAQERNRIGQWPPPAAAGEESEDPAYAVETDTVAAL